MQKKEKPLVARNEFEKFSTEVDFQIVVKDGKELIRARKDLDFCKKLLEKYEKIFSRFDAESEISKMNSKLGIFLNVSPEMREVAELAMAYNKRTSGYFDPRIIGVLENSGYACDFKNAPTSFCEKEKNDSVFKKKLSEDVFWENGKMKIEARMDFAGLAKGWFVDKLSQFLISKGWRNFLVDIGGDMYFSGHGENGAPWYVEVEDVDCEKILLKMDGSGVATSGIGKRKWEVAGKRFHHIINPKNPEEFHFDFKAVTVVSESAMDADVWAKTFFLMGREKGMELAKESGIATLMLDYRGNAFLSQDMKKYLYRENI